MHSFSYIQAATPSAAATAVFQDCGAEFFAGGTTLVDLMKLDVLTPAKLIDVRGLPFSSIAVDGAGIEVGANVSNSDLANHPAVRERFPVLAEALLAGASAQLRNMATVAGNIMQRTRCVYFRDTNANCNRRQPGAGCDAIAGYNRGHALLGTSDQCIATHPSDMCVALAMLDAAVHIVKPDGSKRAIPFEGFHLLPGATPWRETILDHGDLITHISISNSSIAGRSHYLKVRDRASYEFALASAAVAFHLDGETIVDARVALGGIAAKPWRSREAEALLTGHPANTKTFQAAAEAALAGAKPHEHNAFKIELAKRTLVLALQQLT